MEGEQNAIAITMVIAIGIYTRAMALVYVRLIKPLRAGAESKKEPNFYSSTT